MCRSIKTLFNFEPPATSGEIHAAATQFVRKVSGSSRPAKTNAAAFDKAIDDISVAVTELLDSLITKSPPKNREAEAAKTKNRANRRRSQNRQLSARQRFAVAGPATTGDLGPEI